jgi:hypothetical protein
MSFTGDLLNGVGEYLQSCGVGAWRPTGAAYTAGEVPIVRTGLPASPDLAVAIAAYDVMDDRFLNDSTVAVQVVCRGTRDVRDVETLTDGVFDALQGLTSTVLHGVHVVQAYRASQALLGQDGNSRWQSSSNFYFDVARPTRHRID